MENLKTIQTPDSTQTKSISFDSKKNIMYVTFRSNGSTYVYSPVTEEQFMELRNAKSIGAHLHRNFNKRTEGLDIRLAK